MNKKPLIAVIGTGAHAKEKHKKIAGDIGRKIAKRRGIVVCGGRDEGIMEQVAKGVHEEGGISVGILPEADDSRASRYLAIPIKTGMGFARNQIISLTADAVIAIGGGAGTLTELAYAYVYSKPIIVIENSDGLAEQFIGKYMDEKKTVKIHGAKDAKEAVEKAFEMISDGN